MTAQDEKIAQLRFINRCLLETLVELIGPEPEDELDRHIEGYYKREARKVVAQAKEFQQDE
jgi:hypothetical protein